MTPLRFACWVGLQQIVCWGTLTYATAVYAAAMAQQAQISIASVMTAYGAGLLVNALVAHSATRWVIRVGAYQPGWWGMALLVAACMTLSVATHWVWMVCGFMLAGAAMAFTQYDFAFLAVKLYMPGHARRVIAVMTFFGALASTIMWPVAMALASAVGMNAGWRYLALIAVLGSLPALLLCYRLPRVPESDASTRSSFEHPPVSAKNTPPPTRPPSSLWVVTCLIGLAAIGTSLVANLPLLLTQMQVAPTAIASLLPLFGIGQLSARALDFAGSHWVDSRATLVACMSALLMAMLIALLPQSSWWLSALFVFLLGAGNGLATILRGLLPHQLFIDEAFAKTSASLSSLGSLSRAFMPVLVAHIVVLTYGIHLLSIVFALLAAACAFMLLRQLNAESFTATRAVPPSH